MICLISLARALPSCNEGEQATNLNEKKSPPEIQSLILDFPVGHLDHLPFGIVVGLYLKLFKNSVMNNTLFHTFTFYYVFVNSCKVLNVNSNK